MAEINPNDLKDLASALGEIARATQESKDIIEELGVATKSWEAILQQAAADIDSLPPKIRSGKDLWNAMTKDAKVFKLTQDFINKNLDKELKLLGASKEQIKQILRLKDNAFKIAERELKHSQKTNQELVNTNKLVKSWGDNIRHPDKGVDNLLGKIGEFPKSLALAQKETGSLFGAIKKLTNDGLNKLLIPTKALFSPAGLFIAGIGLATAAFTTYFLLFKDYYNFLDKNVIPAVAKFNQQIGGSGKDVQQLKAQSISLGTEFELLGMTFEEGAALVRDFSSGLGDVHLDKETLKIAKDLSAVVGINAKEAGKLAQQFLKQSGSLDGLRDSFTLAEKEATAFGLPVRDVQRDMAEANETLLRFGTRNSLVFAEAAVKARSYGLSIKEVNDAFGEQLDSFESTSKAAANLNSIFGTNINSYDLLLETDPTKRMEMLRKELIKQGKSWERLSVFEQNVIADNLKVDKSQAALILSSEKERRKLEQRAASMKEQQNVQAQWDKGIHQVKKTLIAWGKEISAVMRTVSDFIASLLGFENTSEMISKGLVKVKEGLELVKFTFKDWTDMVKGRKEPSMFIDILLKVKDGMKFIIDVTKTMTSTLMNAIPVIGQLKSAFELGDALYESFDLLSNKITPVWNKFILTIKDKWKDLMEWFNETVKDIPFIGALSEISSSLGKIASKIWESGSELFSQKKSIDDGIITKAGKVIELNPNDNIFATKHPIDSMIPSMAFASPTSISKPSSVENKAVERKSQPQPNVVLEPKIEILRFEIDGKRIAEAQVRISRN